MPPDETQERHISLKHTSPVLLFVAGFAALSSVFVAGYNFNTYLKAQESPEVIYMTRYEATPTPAIPEKIAPKTSSSTTLHILGEPMRYGSDSKWRYAFDTEGLTYKISFDILGTQGRSFEVLKGTLTPLKGFIEYRYARFNEQLFYNGLAVSSAVDTSTFRPLENGQGYHSYGTDGNVVVYETKIIPGADPTTFEILWEPIYEGCIIGNRLSKDADTVFYDITPIEGADPATFEALYNGYAKDERGYYKNGEYIGTEVDVNELTCDYG